MENVRAAGIRLSTLVDWRGEWGLPQSRKRVYVVGLFGKLCARFMEHVCIPVGAEHLTTFHHSSPA
eukprot:1370573-Prorocentrum_lima.AAC.1